jgi:hypothetical protein
MPSLSDEQEEKAKGKMISTDVGISIRRSDLQN